MRGKILILSLVASTLSIACSTSTLAYFTDSEMSNMVFTTGKVKIKNITAAIARSEVDIGTNEEIEHLDGEILASAAEYDDYLANNCTEMLGVSTCNKYIYVQNTGTSDAYMRVRILIPQSLIVDEEGGAPPLTLNKTESDEYIASVQNGVACGENLVCDEYDFVRAEKLTAGQMTRNPVIDSLTYNVIAETGSEEENTEVESQTFDLTATGIKIYTEAIQAQGFASWEEAFNEYDN